MRKTGETTLALALAAALALCATPAAAEGEGSAAGQGAPKATLHTLSLTLDAVHWSWVMGGLRNDVSDAFDEVFFFTPGAELTYGFRAAKYFSAGAALDYLAFWRTGEDGYAVSAHQIRLGPELRLVLPLLADRLRLFLGALGGLSVSATSWEESGRSGRDGAAGGVVAGLCGAEAFFGSWGLALNLRSAFTAHGEGYHMLTMLQLHAGVAYRF